ncbi:MAG: 6-carboxytetrahydropterin synthase [Planctomycetes bacterium]|nr:6-carboxytetrahydropterin synthase [Planctomycetota bacterium]
MFTVTVEAGFCALHRLRLADGAWEPGHGHDWHVRATFSRPGLDDRGMVVDFHDVQQRLREIVGALHHGNLNEHHAFAELSPTAEVVARFVYEQLRAAGLECVRRVEVTEAPGCVAGYEPPAEA